MPEGKKKLRAKKIFLFALIYWRFPAGVDGHISQIEGKA